MYGGTKTEMERLLADAEKISGVKYDISNLSDVFNAIHVIQEELDVTGTTAKESMSTITGSVNSAKSAFSNFLSGAGGIEEVISTFTTAGTNITNAIMNMAPQIITGLTTLMTNLIPMISPLLQLLLPALVDGTVQLIMGLVQAIPQIVVALIEGLTTVLQLLAEQMPTLIPIIIDAILGTIPILLENLPLFVKAGAQLIGGLIAGIINSIPILLARVGEIVVSIVNHFKKLPNMLKSVGKNLVQGLWNGINNAKNWVLNKIKGFGKSILNGIKDIFQVHSPSKAFEWVGKMNMLGFDQGMQDMESKVHNDVNGIFDGMFDLSPNLYGSTSSNLSPVVNVVNNVNVEQDPLGQMVRDIKTFSGGSKNDYNYGGVGG